MRQRRIILVVLALLVAGGFAVEAQKAAPPSQLDEILKAVSTYDGGIESAAMWKLRDYVRARKDDPAGRGECQAKLLAFLKTPATPSAKLAAAKYLRIIGDDQAVAALATLLVDDRASDIALYALQQIPGPVVDKALLQSLALPKASNPTKMGIVSALGKRRSVDAAPALAPLLKQPEFARAAAFALGAIGGEAAAGALAAAFSTSDAKLRPVVGSAIIKCAEDFVATKKQAAALRLYELVSADTSLPTAVRKAATMGLISTSGERGNVLILQMLDGRDVAMQEAAIARIREVVRANAIATFGERLAKLPEVSQVKLLAVLALYPGEYVRSAVMRAARGSSEAVRLAAMKALETTGDETVVPFLIETAVKARGPEQTAARSALGLLKGQAVDEAIVKALAATPADDIQAELMLAIADRRIFTAKPAIAVALTAPSARVRAQAMKTLRVIGTPSDMPAVLDVLVKTTDDGERNDAGQTVAALAQKIANPDGRARQINSRVTAEKDPQVRRRYLAVLPLIGDSTSLPVVRRALNDSDADVFDAAVRALAAWPTPAAREDVLALARDARNETHRLLAIQGLVRIVGLDRSRDPKAAVADLRQAAGYAWRPEEQKLVLGVVSQFPCQDALDLASGFLREPAVKAEAQAAVNRIKQRLEAGRKTT